MESGFSYFVSEKSKFMVITLAGPMDMSAIPALNEIAQAISTSSALLVVLNLVGVNAISAATIPTLATLQQNIRKRPAELRLCGISKNLKELLSRRGVIRAVELADNLEFALQNWQATRR